MRKPSINKIHTDAIRLIGYTQGVLRGIESQVPEELAARLREALLQVERNFDQLLRDMSDLS